MFGVIENAHKNNDRHRGYKGTFNKVCLPDLFNLDWHFALTESIQYTFKVKHKDRTISVQVHIASVGNLFIASFS